MLNSTSTKAPQWWHQKQTNKKPHMNLSTRDIKSLYFKHILWQRGLNLFLKTALSSLPLNNFVNSTHVLKLDLIKYLSFTDSFVCKWYVKKKKIFLSVWPSIWESHVDVHISLHHISLCTLTEKNISIILRKTTPREQVDKKHSSATIWTKEPTGCPVAHIVSTTKMVLQRTLRPNALPRKIISTVRPQNRFFSFKGTLHMRCRGWSPTWGPVKTLNKSTNSRDFP